MSEWVSIEKKKKSKSTTLKFELNRIPAQYQAKSDYSTVQATRVGSFLKNVHATQIHRGPHPAKLRLKDPGFNIDRIPGPGNPFQNMQDFSLKPLEIGLGEDNLHYLNEVDMVIGRGTLVKLMRLFERPDNRHLNDFRFEVKRITSSEDPTISVLRVVDLEPWTDFAAFGHAFEQIMIESSADATYFFRLALLTISIQPDVPPLKLLVTYEVDCLMDKTTLALKFGDNQNNNDDNDEEEEWEVEIKAYDQAFASSNLDYWYQLTLSQTKHIVIGGYQKNMLRGKRTQSSTSNATVTQIHYKTVNELLPITHEARQQRIPQLASLLHWFRESFPIDCDNGSIEFRKDIRNQVALKFVA